MRAHPAGPRHGEVAHAATIGAPPEDLSWLVPALWAEGLVLVNRSAGETAEPLHASELGPERGFYVRRNQDATIELGAAVEPGVHRVRAELGLAGVTTLVLDEQIAFA